LSLPDEAGGDHAQGGRLAWIVPAAGVGAMAAIVAAATLDTRALHHPAAVSVEVKVAAGLGQGSEATPDKALVEDSPDGPLPVIGTDGRQPWQVYARKFDAADTRPRIALIVGGLGLDNAMTSEAIMRLPPEVTLAFSPYARDIEGWVAAARRAGHEVMLGLPMEPPDYPTQDPGPKTLLTSLEPEKNLERLAWVMSRGTNYVGLVGIMGGRFAADRASLEPVLEELKKRGLYFVDDHDAQEGVLATLGPALGMAWAITDRRLDNEPAPDKIDKSLADLEGVAQQDGAALGLGALYPVTLDRVLAWTASLKGKAVVLAPATAVATRQKLPTS
jgi:uncharacterized protein